MEKDFQKKNINEIIEIIRANRSLPINDIKKEIKKKFPQIDNEKLIGILTKYRDEINRSDEKGER